MVAHEKPAELAGHVNNCGPENLIGRCHFKEEFDEILNFKKLVWNSGTEFFGNSECLVGSYGPGARSQSIAIR